MGIPDIEYAVSIRLSPTFYHSIGGRIAGSGDETVRHLFLQRQMPISSTDLKSGQIVDTRLKQNFGTGSIIFIQLGERIRKRHHVAYAVRSGNLELQRRERC